jgi:hypothetical protein
MVSPPSESGRRNVAEMLRAFFTQAPSPWSAKRPE